MTKPTTRTKAIVVASDGDLARTVDEFVDKATVHAELEARLKELKAALRTAGRDALVLQEDRGAKAPALTLDLPGTRGRKAQVIFMDRGREIPEDDLAQLGRGLPAREVEALVERTQTVTLSGEMAAWFVRAHPEHVTGRDDVVVVEKVVGAKGLLHERAKRVTALIAKSDATALAALRALCDRLAVDPSVKVGSRGVPSLETPPAPPAPIGVPEVPTDPDARGIAALEQPREEVVH